MFGRSYYDENEALKKNLREHEHAMKMLLDECLGLLNALSIPEEDTSDMYDQEKNDFIYNALHETDEEGERVSYVIGDSVYDVRKIQAAIRKRISFKDKEISYRREGYYADLLAIALHVAYKKDPSFIKNIWYKIGYQYGLTDEQSQALFHWCLRMNYPYESGLDAQIDNDLELPYSKKDPGEIYEFDIYDEKQADEEYKLLKQFDTGLIDHISEDADYDDEQENLGIADFGLLFDIHCYYDDEEEKPKKSHKKHSSKYDYEIQEGMFEWLTYDGD